MGDQELEKTVKIIKSLIVPVKGGLQLTQLDREFKLNEGKSIPLAKFGFNNVRDLVRSIPEIRLSSDGILTVQSETLAHLTDLVARQKTSKPKGKKQYRPTFGTRPVQYSRPSAAYSAGSTRRPISTQRASAYGALPTYRVGGGAGYQRSTAAAAPVFQRQYESGTTKPTSSKYVESKPPRFVYKTSSTRPLPTVTYPGKNSESASTSTGDPNSNVPSKETVPAVMAKENLSNGFRTAEVARNARSAAEDSHGGFGDSRVRAGESHNRAGESRSNVVLNGESGQGDQNKADKFLDAIRAASVPKRTVLDQQSRTNDGPGVKSDTKPLNLRFGKLRLKDPSTAPPNALVTAPVSVAVTSHSEESAAFANQKAFTMALATSRNLHSEGHASGLKPSLAVWDTMPLAHSVYSSTFKGAQTPPALVPAFSPTRPTLSPLSPSSHSPWETPIAVATGATTADARPSNAQPFATADSSMPEPAQSGPRKPLKPMDRLLRQNIDNDASSRALQILEEERERERRRALGQVEETPAAAHCMPPTPVAWPPAPVQSVQRQPVTVQPVQPVRTENIPAFVDWGRQSALMMIKPLYNNAQLIGDNLFMQVAKIMLDLEPHFQSAGGVPYRIGMCVSGLTLAQAAVEIGRQRAVNPIVVVCLGSIDILMDRDLYDMCRHMLLLLGAMTQESLMIQRVFVCTLPPLPTATQTQRATLVAFNNWLVKYCSESRIFTSCDLFECFLNDNLQIRSQLYTAPVKIDMGSETIIQLQLWNKLGSRVFLDAIREILAV